MIWFEDFQKKFSSLLEEFTQNLEQQSTQQQQSQGNNNINQGFKNESAGIDLIKIQDQEQQNEMRLDITDFYGLYDDEDFKKLLKQNSLIQLESLTVSRNPIFCFFIRILQIVQQSIEESHHLKNWGILNNLLDYINIERSVLVYILIGAQQEKIAFDLSKALQRLYRILQGIKGLRQRVLIDIDTKSFQNRKYNQNPSMHTSAQLRSPNNNMLSQKSSQKKQSNVLHYFSPQQIKDKIASNSPTGFRLDQTGRWQMHNEQNENQNEGEVRINMPNMEQENKQNEKIQNQNFFNNCIRNKKKSCLVYDTAFIQNAMQNERKNSSALNSQTSSPISPISPIFTESEKEFLIVSYEIFFYTHKYSQFYLFDIVKQADENNLNNKNRLNQSKEDYPVSGSESNLNENTTNLNNQQYQNEKILLQQIYEVSASYLQEQQQQYLIPRQKISSLDLDMNDSQTQSTFTQKLSDGFKSTQSYSSGSFSISFPFQSFQLSLNNNSAIGNSYSNKEISLYSYQNENSMEKNNNGFQDEIVNQTNSQDNQQISKSNQNSAINNSMLVSSSINFNSKNTNSIKKTKSLEKQIIGSGSNYLKSLKQACKEQDDYVNSYLKMLLYRQRQNIIKQDVTPKSMPRLQVNNLRIMVSAKSLTFGEASASFQNQDFSKSFSSEEPNTKLLTNIFSQKLNENNNSQGFHRSNSRSSSGGSNYNHHNEIGQYESNTSINEQDFQEEDDSTERNFEEQNQITHSDDLDISANSQISHQSLKHLNINQHHHYNHHNPLFHHLQPHSSKSLKQIKYNLNPDWTRSLSQTQIKKKSQNFVSLMQEVKEEKEDSELFNSLLLDRKKRREKSTSAQQNFSDSQKSLEKDKLGIFNQNSLDTQKSITILRCSASSTKSAAKTEIKICNTSLDSAPNGNQNGRCSQSPSSNNSEILFPRFSQNTHESLVINEQVEIQRKKVESEDDQQNVEPEVKRNSNENDDHQISQEKYSNENPQIRKKKDQKENLSINQENEKIENPLEMTQEKVIKNSDNSKQKKCSEDESFSSSSSSYSSDSSNSSNSNTFYNKQTPQKKKSNEKSSKREKSLTADSQTNKEQLSDSIIKYQNKITKQAKKPKSIHKKSRKERKDSEKQNSEKSRNDSNSASQSSGKMNRTFDTENSSSAASSIIRGKKSFDQDYQLNQYLDLSQINSKNFQRRGGIQVRTALKHLTKGGREFDTLGVVKPNFNLINEINFNYDSPQENSFNKKSSFDINQQSNKNITLNIPKTLNQSQSLRVIPHINLMKSPLASKDTSNQFSLMNEIILDTKQSMNQSLEKKIYNRQSSQESESNKNQIKQKKKNSFFTKILKFFQKNDKDDSNKYNSPALSKELNFDCGYIPPSMDITKNKYLKRGFQMNGMTFYKIKDVISYEKSKGKAAFKSSSMDMDQSYIMNSTIMISPSTTKQNLKNNQTINNNSIYFANTDQIIKSSIQKNNSKNQLLSPIVFSDHFQNQYQSDTPLSNISSSVVEQNNNEEEQFEKELQEMFERSSNQTDYDLQDRKNNLVNLYGKSSNLRQLAKKSSLNYKELSIIADEEMSNENSLANRLAQNNLKKGCNFKKELIKKEINEEQLFTYPRESVNFITYQKEQQRIQKKIKMQSAKNCQEYQIIFNQASNWTKLKLKVKKAFQLHKIYLQKKQFYPKKKELKDFFTLQQQIIYQKQIIKDIERNQEQINNEKQQEEFDPLNYLQSSRIKIMQNSRLAKQLTDDTFDNPF
ncbi:hypothetical protein ABPG72_008807 [Tetrahymena utriculariae]